MWEFVRRTGSKLQYYSFWLCNLLSHNKTSVPTLHDLLIHSVSWHWSHTFAIMLHLPCCGRISEQPWLRADQSRAEVGVSEYSWEFCLIGFSVMAAHEPKLRVWLSIWAGQWRKQALWVIYDVRCVKIFRLATVSLSTAACQYICSGLWQHMQCPCGLYIERLVNVNSCTELLFVCFFLSSDKPFMPTLLSERD